MRARANGRTISGIATVFLASFIAVSASAADLARGQAFSLEMSAGLADESRNYGEIKNRSPGFEQASVTHVNGRIVVVTMRGSNAKPGLGPSNLYCMSAELNEKGPPKVTHQGWLTQLGNGERVANHPSQQCFSKGARAGTCVTAFGSDTGSNRPSLYMMAFSSTCEILGDPQMVSLRRDANDGAPSTFVDEATDEVTTSYYSDGGDMDADAGPPSFADGLGGVRRGGDYSVVGRFKLVNKPNGLVGFEPKWSGPTFGGGFAAFTEIGLVNNIDIGRPAITSIPGKPGWTLACAPQGGNRPSMHIGCATLDENGIVKSQSRPFEGNAAMKMYYNQVSLAALPGIAGGHYIAINSNSSNAGGKNTNVKGTNTQNIAMAKIEEDGTINVVDRSKGFAAYQTHSAVCAGTSGVIGQSEGDSIMVTSASPTGVGRAMVNVLHWAPGAGFSSDPIKDKWPISYYSDSGHLANYYGRNPMRQGRDFLNCVGNVANPGFGKEGGFMSDVKTLTIATVSGRKPGSEKNGQFMGVIPGSATHEFDAPVNPTFEGDAPAATDVTPATGNTASADSGCSVTPESDSSLPRNLGALGASAGLLAIVSRLRRRSSR